CLPIVIWQTVFNLTLITHYVSVAQVLRPVQSVLKSGNQTPHCRHTAPPIAVKLIAYAAYRQFSVVKTGYVFVPAVSLRYSDVSCSATGPAVLSSAPMKIPVHVHAE